MYNMQFKFLKLSTEMACHYKDYVFIKVGIRTIVAIGADVKLPAGVHNIT